MTLAFLATVTALLSPNFWLSSWLSMSDRKRGWQQGRSQYSGKRTSPLVDKIPQEALVSHTRVLKELLVVVLHGVEKVLNTLSLASILG